MIRRVAIACVLAVSVQTACGSAATASPTSTAAAQPSPTATASASPSPVAATPSPTATPTATPAPTEFVDHGHGHINWGETSAPEFNGRAPELVGGKVTYTDGKGEVAEWKPNLSISGRATGVFVVRPDVVTAMTKQARDAGHFQFAIPVDLRGVDNTYVVRVGFDNSFLSLPTMTIGLPGGDTMSPLVEVNPYNEGYVVVVSANANMN